MLDLPRQKSCSYSYGRKFIAEFVTGNELCCLIISGKINKERK